MDHLIKPYIEELLKIPALTKVEGFAEAIEINNIKTPCVFKNGEYESVVPNDCFNSVFFEKDSIHNVSTKILASGKQSRRVNTTIAIVAWFDIDTIVDLENQIINALTKKGLKTNLVLKPFEIQYGFEKVFSKYDFRNLKQVILVKPKTGFKILCTATYELKCLETC